MEVQLEKFNLNWIQKTDKIFIQGPLSCGKTTLIRDILYHQPELIKGCMPRYDFYDFRLKELGLYRDMMGNRDIDFYIVDTHQEFLCSSNKCLCIIYSTQVPKKAISQYKARYIFLFHSFNRSIYLDVQRYFTSKDEYAAIQSQLREFPYSCLVIDTHRRKRYWYKTDKKKIDSQLSPVVQKYRNKVWEPIHTDLLTYLWKKKMTRALDAIEYSPYIPGVKFLETKVKQENE